MYLYINFFKESGKWYATTKLPITEEKLEDLLRTREFSLVKQYIRDTQKEVYNPDQFYWSVTLENQPDKSPLFCRFLYFPFNENPHY